MNDTFGKMVELMQEIASRMPWEEDETQILDDSPSAAALREIIDSTGRRLLLDVRIKPTRSILRFIDTNRHRYPYTLAIWRPRKEAQPGTLHNFLHIRGNTFLFHRFFYREKGKWDAPLWTVPMSFFDAFINTIENIPDVRILSPRPLLLKCSLADNGVLVVHKVVPCCPRSMENLLG
uniref:Uncharacterized protein n=1 Tax=Chromera velia CCMP2878 TaxID=1169474 RepID=A0A0G4I200_9ALVE|eukprot:Cvel_34816.t1-p1 / transcript=Cvel_34816.t1 / gene=Cvel_34816 / organism=Chromera_velia_CCMP2878 / gene_product=hypothetical protein / transcript_product=hypothetical protein / location=Cvel_scaffold6112:449-979(+) / protein_length=177 / sequence_SO=supercontig / SO=protein_coding / is_pseudo=false